MTLNRVLLAAFVVLVVVPLVWLLLFGIGHATGHSGGTGFGG